ncbi:hypothetical protein KS527_004566 [Salmonella enterica]|nr:hypothetical protein [Salmonella enterica]EJF7575651.1 hypothetical protein [Salmonella enterica subsp. enterica]
MSVYFNGQLLVTPVTASAVNDDAMLNQNLSVGNTVAYIGTCTGGKPQTVLSFGNPDEARLALKSGDLCEAVVNAFAPSSETGSPQTVLAIRVDKPAPASLDLLVNDGTSDSVLLTLEGASHSLDDTKIQVKLEASQGVNPAAPTNLVDITITDGTTTWSKKEVNMTPARIDIHKANCGFSVRDTHFTLIFDGKSHDVPFNAYPTLGHLKSYVDNVTDAAGDRPFEFVILTSPRDDSLPSNIFDKMTVGSATGVNHYLDVNLWSIKNWIASEPKLAAIVNVVDGPFSMGGPNGAYHGQPVVHNYKNLVQGAAGYPTPVDWQDAISLLDTKDVQWVQALSGLGVVHDAVATHCHMMSNTFRRERRAIVGTDLGCSDADAIAKAKALNSDRISLVHIGHYAYDLTGKLVLRPAYMTAGLIAAMFGGVNAGTPLTNKVLNVQGLERELRNPTDTDALILGGVLPVENTETGYKITQSISTWLKDSKYNRREQSCGVAVDFAIRNVRQALDVLRGQKQSPILLARAISIAKGSLTELARPEPQGPAVLVGDKDHPAWRNVTATVEGDVLRVQFEGSPAIPNNYVLVTMYAVPYSGSATA